MGAARMTPGQQVRFGYLGPRGTFTHAALLRVPGAHQSTLIPQSSIGDALDAVRRLEIDAAMVPLENSVEGVVPATQDALTAQPSLQILREVQLPVRLSVAARPGTELVDVATVATHPHAEAQSRQWLRTHLPRASVSLVASTAEGARLAACGHFDAAIAAPEAAQEYALVQVAEDIQDKKGASTRFVLVAQPGPHPERTGADRTSLCVFIANDRPGALLEILEEFAARNVNLSRIESRPTGEALGQYYFWLDCHGHVLDDSVAETLRAVRLVSREVRLFGSYPRADAAKPRGVNMPNTDNSLSWWQELRGAT